MLTRQWLNQNSAWAYPVDDEANETSDAGELLPTDAIADLAVRWPSSYGDYAFVSSVLLSPGLVAVTLQVSDNPNTGFQPLASLSVARKSLDRRVYPLEPAVPGVGGWLAFSEAAIRGDLYQGRFSAAKQTRLSGRAGRPYRPLPIPSLGRLGTDGLLGDVRIAAKDPLRIDVEEREILGQMKRCFVFRLASASIGSVPVVVDNDKSVFAQFAGDCGGRPETRTCPDPQPHEFINSVGPDCNGVLTFRFTGCAHMTPLRDKCGVVVNCDVSLEDSCKPPDVANDQGYLPSEYDPKVIEEPPDTSSEPPAVSEPFQSDGALPYLQCFDGFVAPSWVVKAGEFSFTADDPPASPCPRGSEPASEPASLAAYATEGPASASLRNLSVWNGFDTTTLWRKTTLAFKLMPGPLGAKHNAGLAINVKSSGAQNTFYLAEADQDAMKFRIARFNGSAQATLADVDLTALSLEHWYRIDVFTTPQVGSSNALIAATLYDLEFDAVVAAIGETLAAAFYPSNGRFGIHANRANTRFGWFTAAEYTG
jgi:hypothetical protein